MKKFIALLLCLCMVFAVVACGGAEDKDTGKETGNNETNAPETNKEADYKLGMGIVVGMDSSAENNAQVDATVVTTVTDAEGKIVALRIDVAQSKMDVTGGAVDVAKEFKTKMELGADYGMATYGASMDNNGDGKVLEWDAQAKAYEAWAVGKTLADIEAMTTQEAGGHQISTDEALLTAGCTIDIVDFKEATVKALKDEQGMSFKTAEAFTLGLAAKTTAAESVAATADANGTVKMYSDFAATVIADGKIIATINDAIQPNITVDVNGAIVETAFTDTKRNLKEGYNMATYGANLDNNGDGKVLEWYLQSEAFSKHIVGMTGAEVAGMETAAATQGSVGYMISTDADLLAAGCTIQIAGMCAAVAQAAANAR